MSRKTNNSIENISSPKNERSKSKIKSIGLPENVKHNVHVDLDFTWTGEDPNHAFKIIKKLGEGAYGAVFKALHQDTGLTVAIKKVKLIGGKHAKEEIKKEIDLLKKCRHFNIVSYWGCCFHENELWILMDFCGIGSVLDLIGDNDKELKLKNIKEEQIAAILSSVVKGLVYLHSRGIIHRDIKCANILINDKGEAKIADFGVAASLSSETDSNLSVIGTPLWIAPEILTGTAKFDFSSDIWSLGITAIELACGKPPYSGENIMRALYRIGTEPPPKLPQSQKYSKDFVNFVDCCLKRNPEDRPKAVDLFLHPFVASAKDPSVVFKDLVDEYQRIKSEEEASNELWSLNIITPSLTLKTSVIPVITCGEFIKKIAKKFPPLGPSMSYGLFLDSENIWLEDARKLLYYRSLLKDHNYSISLKGRPDSVQVIGESELTILKKQLLHEQERNAVLEQENFELRAELQKVKEQLERQKS